MASAASIAGSPCSFPSASEVAGYYGCGHSALTHQYRWGVLRTCATTYLSDHTFSTSKPHPLILHCGYFCCTTFNQLACCLGTQASTSLHVQCCEEVHILLHLACRCAAPVLPACSGARCAGHAARSSSACTNSLFWSLPWLTHFLACDFFHAESARCARFEHTACNNNLCAYSCTYPS